MAEKNLHFMAVPCDVHAIFSVQLWLQLTEVKTYPPYPEISLQIYMSYTVETN